MKRIILFATCSLMVCAGAFAQQKEEPKLVVKPSGRILMDAGAMHSTDKTVDALLNMVLLFLMLVSASVPHTISGK